MLCALPFSDELSGEKHVISWILKHYWCPWGALSIVLLIAHVVFASSYVSAFSDDTVRWLKLFEIFLELLHQVSRSSSANIACSGLSGMTQ